MTGSRENKKKEKNTTDQRTTRILKERTQRTETTLARPNGETGQFRGNPQGRRNEK